jgi:hypothetical protein
VYKPIRLKARGLAQHGGPPGCLEESDPAGVILYVMDGPHCLSFPYLAKDALTGVAQLRGDGISSCCYIVNVHKLISESIVAPLLTPATGARRRQQSLPAECGQPHCPGPSSNPGRGKCDFFLVAL